MNADGYDELYPSVDLLGNLYFARVKAPIPTEDVDIWRAKRRWDGSDAAPERLGPGVNTAERWEFNPEISPGGRTLLFVRLDRPDDGLEDEFGAGQNLGPCVNTAADEFHPTMLWERNELYFARDAGAPSNFHRTRVVLPRRRARDATSRPRRGQAVARPRAAACTAGSARKRPTWYHTSSAPAPISSA